jgi:hypothetical protein
LGRLFATSKKVSSPVFISGCVDHWQQYFSVIFESISDPKWVVRIDLAEETYNDEFASYNKQGYQLQHLNAYNDLEGRNRFIAIWGAPGGVSKPSDHRMTAKEFQTKHKTYLQSRHRLLELRGYSLNEEPRLAAIWEKRDGPKQVVYLSLDLSTFNSYKGRRGYGSYALTNVSPDETEGGVKIAAVFTEWTSDELVWRSEVGLLDCQHLNIIPTSTI